jgi:hypothetical protein
MRRGRSQVRVFRPFSEPCHYNENQFLVNADYIVSSNCVLAEGSLARDPANTQWQRDISVSHNKIGNMLMMQGDGAGH